MFENFTLAHQLRRRVRIVAPSLRRDLERSYALDILLRKHKAIRDVRSVPARSRSVSIRPACPGTSC